MRVYLAGPITGLSYDNAMNWREQAEKLLQGIDCYSPMRGCRYLAGEASIPAQQVQHDTLIMASNMGILVRDRTDCINADALLVYFQDGCSPSLGTAMEIAWSHLKHIPVVAVASKNNVHRQHPMLNQCCLFVDTLEQGCEMIRSILLPGG